MGSNSIGEIFWDCSLIHSPHRFTAAKCVTNVIRLMGLFLYFKYDHKTPRRGSGLSNNRAECNVIANTLNSSFARGYNTV